MRHTCPAIWHYALVIDALIKMMVIIMLIVIVDLDMIMLDHDKDDRHMPCNPALCSGDRCADQDDGGYHADHDAGLGYDHDKDDREYHLRNLAPYMPGIMHW